MKKLNTTLIKIVLTFTLVTVIFSALVLKPTEEGATIEDANADIGTFFGRDGASEFTYAMAGAGIQPRAFNLNGNTMFFGHTYSTKSPKELLNIYSEYLVDEGINKQRYQNDKGHASQGTKHDLSNPNARAALKPMLDQRQQDIVAGEVVPVQVTDDYVSMSGVMFDQTPDQMLEKMRTTDVDASNKTPMKSMMKGYRFLEFQREEKGTLITAVWTDDEFNAHKLDNTHFIKEPADTVVPACAGCDRAISFEALMKNEPYKVNRYEGTSPPSTNRAFYQRAMANRGWKISRSQDFLDRAGEYLPELRNMNGQMLTMEKDGSHIDMAFLPTQNGGSSVYTMQRKSGGEMVQKTFSDFEPK